jgi:hypothetical protein
VGGSDAGGPILGVGLSAVVEEPVTGEMTTAAFGSGDVPVLATPAVLSLVERAAVEAVRDHLPSGTTTVGASVALAHHAIVGLWKNRHEERGLTGGSKLKSASNVTKSLTAT